MPKVSTDFVFMLRSFYPLIKLGWEAGKTYSDLQNNKKWSFLGSI